MNNAVLTAIAKLDNVFEFFFGGWYHVYSRMFIVTTNEELAWLYHKDLSILKHWAGQPQNGDQWNQKWDAYQGKKQKIEASLKRGR